MPPDKKHSGLALIIGKAHDEPDDDDDSAVDDAELDAYKAMNEATSDEDGAKALKAFIKLCSSGGY